MVSLFWGFFVRRSLVGRFPWSDLYFNGLCVQWFSSQTPYANEFAINALFGSGLPPQVLRGGGELVGGILSSFWWLEGCLEAFWEMEAMRLDIGGFEAGKWEAGGWNMGGQNLIQGGFGGAGHGFGGQGRGHTGGGETRKQLNSHSRSLPS